MNTAEATIDGVTLMMLADEMWIVWFCTIENVDIVGITLAAPCFLLFAHIC
jgi:hypothetical protein